MAAKTLTSVVGNQYQLGDIIRSSRTTLADGRSLIACDGAATVAKPLLDAVLPTSIVIGPQASTLQNSSSVRMIRSEKWAASKTNNIFIGASQETSSEVQHFVKDGASSGFTIIGQALGCAISSDGAKSFIVAVETTTNDLEIYYNEASALPNTFKNLDAAVNYDFVDGHCLISDDGEVCKVMVQENAVNDIHIWTSTDGPGGTWTQITAINPAQAVARNMAGHQARGTATLADMIFGTDQGLWISDDTGATWTEDVLVPDGSAPSHYALSADGNTIYATNVNATRCYKTTDKGSNWTTIFHLGERDPNWPHSSRPLMVCILVDSSDNLYLLMNYDNQSSGLGHDALGIQYSTDGGTTWANSYLQFMTQPYLGSVNSFWNLAKDVRLNSAATELIYPINDSTDIDNIHFMPITTDKLTPRVWGDGWKMVAD